LEQVAERQYETGALADGRVGVQPKTSESYRTIMEALAKRCTEFHTYKLEEEGGYKLVLRSMHCSINPQGIKDEIEKLGHTVASVWNIKQYRTKLLLSTAACPE
jgi:hypothetical protein